MWNVLSTVPVGAPVALVLPVGCPGGAFYFSHIFLIGYDAVSTVPVRVG